MDKDAAKGKAIGEKAASAAAEAPWNVRCA